MLYKLWKHTCKIKALSVLSLKQVRNLKPRDNNTMNEPKCYTCEHIKTFLFRLCIQLMGYEGSHKQNKFNIVHFPCNYFLITYSQRIDTNLRGKTVFPTVLRHNYNQQQRVRAFTCTSQCKGRKAQVQSYRPRRISLLQYHCALRGAKRLVSWLIICSNVEKSIYECKW